MSEQTGYDEKNKCLIAVLIAGKEIYQEIKRNLFVSDIEFAERLCCYSKQFISALVIASRHLESHEDIINDVFLLAAEFQHFIYHFEQRFHDLEQGEQYQCPQEGSNESRGRGRPKLRIPKEQLQGLRSLGFSWASIAKMLSVSEKTLRRKRDEYDFAHKRFSDISDDELDNLTQTVLQMSPNSGERMVMGWLRAKGICVQRWKIRNSIWRVDPVSRVLRQRTVTQRRVYNVPTPNSLWHLDGHHKLIRWRIVIHGAIDGYSRVVVYLKASTNNKASTVLDLFKAATQVYHYPRRIRTDYGTENVDVARDMLNRYGPNSRPVLTGRSVHNQRIERLWRDVHNYVVMYYKNIFYYLESMELLDPNNELDLFALHFVFLPRLEKAVNMFMVQWNNHPLSSEGQCTPLQKWTQGFYKFAQSDHVTVKELLDLSSVDLEHYGIDDDGPVPSIETENHVEVPRSTVELSALELATLANEVDPLVNDFDHGVSTYQTARNVLCNIITSRSQ